MDLDKILERCYACELLTADETFQLCLAARDVLSTEPNVLAVSSPVSVVGDLHGQFYDLLELFRVGGKPPDTNYLFLGDYVDRGLHSVQTIALLLALKVRYPRRIFLIRGNHETRQITQVYGFYAECMRKYGSADVWRYFTDVFDCLAIAAVVDDAVFCVHGGLSPSIQCLGQIASVYRFMETPHEGALSDFVWSDPDPDPLHTGFASSNRGAGFTFCEDIVSKFLAVNNLRHILRAHQLCMEGYQIIFDNKLSTVWSAPNYCNRCGNLASVLLIETDLTFHFEVFGAAPVGERGEKNASSNGKDDVLGGPKVEYFL